jgi:hypothetical protein
MLSSSLGQTTLFLVLVAAAVFCFFMGARGVIKSSAARAGASVAPEDEMGTPMNFAALAMWVVAGLVALVVAFNVNAYAPRTTEAPAPNRILEAEAERRANETATFKPVAPDTSNANSAAERQELIEQTREQFDALPNDE